MVGHGICTKMACRTRGANHRVSAAALETNRKRQLRWKNAIKCGKCILLAAGEFPNQLSKQAIECYVAQYGVRGRPFPSITFVCFISKRPKSDWDQLGLRLILLVSQHLRAIIFTWSRAVSFILIILLVLVLPRNEIMV